MREGNGGILTERPQKGQKESEGRLTISQAAPMMKIVSSQVNQRDIDRVALCYEMN